MKENNIDCIYRLSLCVSVMHNPLSFIHPSVCVYVCIYVSLPYEAPVVGYTREHDN